MSILTFIVLDLFIRHAVNVFSGERGDLWDAKRVPRTLARRLPHFSWRTLLEALPITYPTSPASPLGGGANLHASTPGRLECMQGYAWSLGVVWRIVRLNSNIIEQSAGILCRSASLSLVQAFSRQLAMRIHSPS
jgi:hypothetical protein